MGCEFIYNSPSLFPSLMAFSFPHPPTQDSLAHAKLRLENTQNELVQLHTKMVSAQSELTRYLIEAKSTIMELDRERIRLKDEEATTKAYLSPIRRLPAELLREIFLWNFEEHASCAWVLATVCSSWRALALKTPKIWSKIRLVTTPTSSPELLRLWLERSGHRVPLDIEIYLRVVDPIVMFNEAQKRRIRRASPSSSSVTSTSPYLNSTLQSQLSLLLSPQNWAHLSNNNTFTPPRSPATSDSLTGASTTPMARPNIHWAHIAFYYLVEQMPRWERFVFRYDKAFKSMTALASINGDAPMLKEFEVSSAEGGCTGDWPWLPNNNDTSSSTPFLPKLTSLSLQNVPFKWSSSIFSSSLKNLNLRAPINPPLPLDRIKFIIQNIENVEYLSLHFQGVLINVLPLLSSKIILRNLTNLKVGGHHLLSQILDTLVLPNLQSLAILIDPRESLDEPILSLLMRSGFPALEELNLGYVESNWIAGGLGSGMGVPGNGNGNGNNGVALGMGNLGMGMGMALGGMGIGPGPGPGPGTNMAAMGLGLGGNIFHGPGNLPGGGPGSGFVYYMPSGIVSSWRILLEKLGNLKVLKVGGTPIEGLLVLLGTGDNGNNNVQNNGLGGGGAHNNVNVNYIGNNSGNGNGWVCPKLESLSMRGCMMHSEAIMRLVHTIEVRNPDNGFNSSSGGSGVGSASLASILNTNSNSNSTSGVKRLKHLELQDCELGPDVERWLNSRVENVVCSDSGLGDRGFRRRRYF